ncbi:hypothetical protein TRAPUB_1019 [Trametes pubescens]|uniref:Uncharacterized protein n=1 Tax=Trametes pubescens TaxID=154538 RepID=A0A1M2VKF4_TRAPU|nr:hypothetical protein TRAPUB_1019 [Trametes pubescens]
MQVASLVLAFAVGASRAKPVYLANRDAVAPPITNPTAQTVWRTGETQTVTWDVSALNGSLPSNPLAEIILGTLTPDGDEHLMFQTPLVSGFPLLGGNVTLTVPSVPSGETYIVCRTPFFFPLGIDVDLTDRRMYLVFGTSDDISPMFTIIGTDASSSTVASSASSSSAPSPSGPASSTTSVVDESSAIPAATTGTTSVVSATPTSPSSSTTARTNPPPASLSGSTDSASATTGNATAAAVSSPSGSASAAAGTSGALRIGVQGHLWCFCLASVLALALS